MNILDVLPVDKTLLDGDSLKWVLSFTEQVCISQKQKNKYKKIWIVHTKINFELTCVSDSTILN